MNGTNERRDTSSPQTISSHAIETSAPFASSASNGSFLDGHRVDTGIERECPPVEPIGESFVVDEDPCVDEIAA